MSAVLNFLLPILTAACLVLAVLQLTRGLRQRQRIGQQVYGVGKVNAQRQMRIGFLAAVALFVLGLLFLGIWGVLLTRPEREPVQVVATPQPSATATITFEVTETVPLSAATETVPPTAVATRTPPPTRTPAAATDTPFPQVTPTPILTPTPSVPTAVVTSGVGVYLRAQPNTVSEQVEWLLEGTILIILPERVQGEEFEWQQVRTPTGNEGWVAVPFIEYNQ